MYKHGSCIKSAFRFQFTTATTITAAAATTTTTTMTAVTVFCNLFTSASNQNIQNHKDVHHLCTAQTALHCHVFVKLKEMCCGIHLQLFQQEDTPSRCQLCHDPTH
jgi:hypothetical protein